MRRTLAPIDFNNTWKLLDRDSLTPEQEEEMIAGTLAQRHNWYQVGDSRNKTIADWQVARVASLLGLNDLARRFAERSLAVSTSNELGPFYVGYAHEAIARASVGAGNAQLAEQHLQFARSHLQAIEDEEERNLLAADVDEVAGYL